MNMILPRSSKALIRPRGISFRQFTVHEWENILTLEFANVAYSGGTGQQSFYWSVQTYNTKLSFSPSTSYGLTLGINKDSPLTNSISPTRLKARQAQVRQAPLRQTPLRQAQLPRPPLHRPLPRLPNGAQKLPLHLYQSQL